MYLGIDVGTSSVKGVLTDDSQWVIATETADLEVSRPKSGWSEQEPPAWWRAWVAILGKLAAEQRAHLSAVKGIGISGQVHGATLLDDADQPLRPCILWNDGRSETEAAELTAACERITGNIAIPGFTDRRDDRAGGHAGLPRCPQGIAQSPSRHQGVLIE